MADGGTDAVERQDGGPPPVPGPTPAARTQEDILALPPPGKPKIYISYSRRDSLAFAEQLAAGLEVAGFEPSFDRHAVSASEDWRKRRGALIVEADAVAFVLSPGAAASEVCTWEAEESGRLRKRLVPIVSASLGAAAAPQRLAELNYIFFYPEEKARGSGFGTGLAKLVAVLSTDLAWVREHTRLTIRAADWEARGRPPHRLLTRNEILEAQTWVTRQPRTAPDPSILQLNYLEASVEREAARERDEEARREEITVAQDARARALSEGEAAQRERAAALATRTAALNRAERSRKRVRRYALVLTLLAAAVAASAIVQERASERLDARVLATSAADAVAAQKFDKAMRFAVFGLPPPGAAPWSVDWSDPAMRALKSELAKAAAWSATGGSLEYDPSWSGLSGPELRDRVCTEKLTSAQLFTEDELHHPVLNRIPRGDPARRNPCLRRGPLSRDYYVDLLASLRRQTQALARRWRAPQK